MLYKNTYKLFKKKKFQLLGVGIIIFLSSFMYVAMYNATNSMEVTLEKFTKECNQEDFAVEIFQSLMLDETIKEYPMAALSDIKNLDKNVFENIMDKRKNAFEKLYPDTRLELRDSKDILFQYKTESYKIRALKDSETINLSEIEEGRKPSSDNEIALPEIFLEGNSLQIGDKFNINDKDYNIVGTVLFPDYTMLMSGKEFILDNSKITVALFTDKEFDNIKGKEEFRFAGVSDNKIDSEYFNKGLDFVINVTESSSNMRSGYLVNEIKMSKSSIIGLSMMITSIAIIIVGIIVYKILQNEKGQIGILKAMGYLNKEIGRPYLVLISVIALPMLILGSIIGNFASQPLIDLFAEFYLFPREGIVFSFKGYFIAIIVPFIFFFGLSYIIIRSNLKKKPLDLLKVGEDGRITWLDKIADKLLSKAKTTTKFKYSFLLRNKGKFYVFILGIIFASFLIIMGLMMPGFFDKMSTEGYKLVDYKYEAGIDMTKDLPAIIGNQEKILTIPIKYQGKNITLKGIDCDNKLYKIYDKKKNEITSSIKDGIVISNSFSMIFDKEKGDSLTLTINEKEEEFEIIDVSKEYGEAQIYFQRSTLSKLYSKGENSDLYTGIYSDKPIDKENYSYVIEKQQILEQSKSVQGFMYLAIGVMLGISIVISVIVLFVLTSLTVEDNFYNISLLKVMGYSKKEVNSMIINSYFSYAIIAFFISIPITIASMGYFTESIGNKFDIVLPFIFEPWEGIVGLSIVVIIFYLGSINSKRKIDKISLQEVLKEYRE